MTTIKKKKQKINQITQCRPSAENVPQNGGSIVYQLTHLPSKQRAESYVRFAEEPHTWRHQEGACCITSAVNKIFLSVVSKKFKKFKK